MIKVRLQLFTPDKEDKHNKSGRINYATKIQKIWQGKNGFAPRKNFVVNFIILIILDQLGCLKSLDLFIGLKMKSNFETQVHFNNFRPTKIQDQHF